MGFFGPWGGPCSEQQLLEQIGMNLLSYTTPKDQVKMNGELEEFFFLGYNAV
jgi:hypothetical protein